MKKTLNLLSYVMVIVLSMSFLVVAGPNIDFFKNIDIKIKQIDPSDLNAVKAYVELISKEKELDKKITKDNFEIIENGKKCAILDFTKIKQDVSVVLLIDISGSMRRRIGSVRDAVKDFISSIGDNYEICMVGFDSDFHIFQNFTNDKNILIKQLNKVVVNDPWAATALYDSLFLSSNLLKSRKGRKLVILFTDGVDANRKDTGPGSKRTLEAGIQPLIYDNMPAYILALGTKVDRNIVKKITDKTNGDKYFIDKKEDISSAYQDINKKLLNEYIITYKSAEQDRDVFKRNLSVSFGGEAASMSKVSRDYYIESSVGTARLVSSNSTIKDKPVEIMKNNKMVLKTKMNDYFSLPFGEYDYSIIAGQEKITGKFKITQKDKADVFVDDKVAPELNIISPGLTATEYVKGQAIKFDYSVTDNSPVKLKIKLNDKIVDLKKGDYLKELQSNNKLEVEATDIFGNKSKNAITFRVVEPSKEPVKMTASTKETKTPKKTNKKKMLLWWLLTTVGGVCLK